jgi:glycosyl transferase, family 25
MFSYNDISNIWYINLEDRIDRRIHIENELKKVNWIGHRFNAIKYNPGFMGCSMSHIEVLKCNIGKSHVLVLEDDFEIIDCKTFQQQLTYFFENVKEWDVVKLQYFTFESCRNEWIEKTQYEKIYKPHRTHSGAGYLVNGNYISKLCDVFIDSLKISQRKNIRYDIDIAWWDLMEKDKWFCFYPQIAKQYISMSDIENKPSNWDFVHVQIADTHTPDNINYIPIYPIIRNNSFEICIDAKNDGHILVNDEYEIVIGGWNCTKSIIRDISVKPNKELTNYQQSNKIGSEKILEENKFKKFMISIDNNILKVIANKIVILNYPIKYSEIESVEIHTGYGSTGLWSYDKNYDLCDE